MHRVYTTTLDLAYVDSSRKAMRIARDNFSQYNNLIFAVLEM